MFWKEILILLGGLAIFFGSIYLNRRTKAPEGVEYPDECQTCTNIFCSVKKEAKQQQAKKQASAKYQEKKTEVE